MKFQLGGIVSPILPAGPRQSPGGGGGGGGGGAKPRKLIEVNLLEHLIYCYPARKILSFCQINILKQS